MNIKNIINQIINPYIKTNYSLKDLNTFQLDVKAKFFKEIKNKNDLIKVNKFAKDRNMEIFVLGEGSNTVFANNILNKVCIKFKNQNIQIISEDKDKAIVFADAGVNWHQFVLWSLDNKLQGAENLSLIPGTVGAAPIQNIGAYGVEIKDILVSLKVFDLNKNQETVIKKEKCKFNYRDSIFKTNKNLVILGATFTLNKNFNKINLSFQALKHLAGLNAKQLSNEIIKIRKSKLPNPKEIPNIGSFFKNPIINNKEFQNIQNIDPNVIYFKTKNKKIKISAAYLIESLNFKNKVINNISVYQHQALVIIKLRNEAKGHDILNFANQIIKGVFKKFRIKLEVEPNIVI